MPRSPTTTMARHFCFPFLIQLLSLLIIVLPPSSAWKLGGGSKPTTTSSTSSSTSHNPSLRALDQELLELAELIRLQTEKLRVLETYRRQVASGAVDVKGGPSAASQCAASVFAPPSLSLGSSIDGGTSSALAEDYLVRLAALPAIGSVNEGTGGAEAGENGRVTALKMLTFQRVRDKAAPRGSHMQNSKAMNVLVVARADTGGNMKEEKGKRRSSDSTDSASSGRAPWLSFYDMSGQLLGQYAPPGHASAPITTLAFEAVGGEDALLVTGARDGSLSLHNVQLWKDGKIVVGQQPSAPSISSSNPPSFVVPPNVTSSDGYGVQILHEATLLSSDAQTKNDGTPVIPPAAASATATAATNLGSPVLSALLYQYRGYGWMVFSGDAAGNIQCHFRNGTLFKAIYTGHPIHALTRNGKTLLYTADRDVHFLSAMTLAPFSTAYCRGRHGPLRSLAWDSLAPQVLHASTAHGDLLTFDTSPPHARRGQPHQQQQQMYGGAAVEGNCALVKKLASRTGGSAPLSLATVPGGYLLAVSTRGDIFAYNTTGHLRDTASPLPLVFHLNFPPPAPWDEEGSPAILFSASLGRAMNVGAAAALTRMSPNFVVHMGKCASGSPSADKQASRSDHDGHLMLFEAILPYRRPKALEFSWIRLPLMCLALGLVFFWHFSKERRGKRPGLAGMERNPMPEPVQLRNIGLRPNGRRMYDLVEEDEDELEERDEDKPGGSAGARDDDEQNRQLRGLLRARQARNFAF